MQHFVDYLEEDTDEMKVRSSFLKGIISSVVSNTLRKKLGKNLNMDLRGLDVSIDKNVARVHIEIDAEMPKDELKAIIFEKLL